MNAICLNMIVRNESKAIRRCLASVKNVIHSWVIVDTGSTDGTQEIVREELSDVPGVLYERPWIDFAANRNEALQLAKGRGEYLLFIDADEEIVFSKEFFFPPLYKDCYFAVKRLDSCESLTRFLVKQSLDWRWVGALHEEILCEDARSGKLLHGIEILAIEEDGKRSLDAGKYRKDLLVIQRELEKDPQNTRYATYLGITYEWANEDELALAAFEKRALLGGYEEEVFYSLYRIAHLQRKQGMSPQTFIESYKKAYRSRPSRIEPLYWLAHYYSGIQAFEEAYQIAKLGVDTPLPRTDVIYLEAPLYRYGLLLLFVKCSYQTGRYFEAFKALTRLEKIPDLPPERRLQVEEALPHVRDLTNRDRS